MPESRSGLPAPETDLARMLATLAVTVRPDDYVFVAMPASDPAIGALAQAMICEDEGVTYVVRRGDADARQLRYDFVAAWLSLTVYSALHAVGLTAAVSAALASRGISCNVLAGFHHDHLLVPADRRDDAVAALAELARTAR